MFHARSPRNMVALFVTKSEPTMLMAVARLPEYTKPDTYPVRAQNNYIESHTDI